MATRRKTPDKVIPEDEGDPTDLSSLRAPEPPSSLPRAPQRTPGALVNINMGRNVVDESHGPQDTDKSFQMEDIFGSETTAQFNPLSELLSEDDINMKTDLTQGLIVALARCEAAAKMFEVPELTDFCHAIKTMRVSLNRKGRIEIVEAIKGHPPVDGSTNFIDRLRSAMKS